jgi:hypothetical protein
MEFKGWQTYVKLVAETSRVSSIGANLIFLTYDIFQSAGNFSFGSFTKFKSNTIVDFIENAVEHSRSGRFLFFLLRRPVSYIQYRTLR